MAQGVREVDSALMETDLPLGNRRQGKVRDVYDTPLPDGGDGLVLVATDRISAFDVVMDNGIPGKGVVLTQISRFWFDHFADRVPHHLVSTDPEDLPALDADQRRDLRGRVMICRKTDPLPVELVVRGYLAGSGWKEYQKWGTVCGVELPPGLSNGSRLEAPIFTPATKATEGHDENISFDRACALAGADRMASLRETSMAMYREAREHAAERGILIADTKFEFGLVGDGQRALLIDEVLTPDSSRFWPADRWEPGKEQENFDKQYVRNYLQDLVDRGEWDKRPPGPRLSEEVVENTLGRYREAYRTLAGEELSV